MAYRKQHIVPVTYIKYFSPNYDGKDLQVLYTTGIKKWKMENKNSGDSIFWEENFYNTSQFDNPKYLEQFFGQAIESRYNELIDVIKDEKEIHDEDLKVSVFQWIFYSKLRSPMWREYLMEILNTNGHTLDFNAHELREEHLRIFSNPDLFEYILEYYESYLTTKQWKILIQPKDNSWITSDNPGFHINVSELEKEKESYVPNPLWTGIQHDSVLYFPLTQKYCILIKPYNTGDDVNLNFNNDGISFEKSGSQELNLINAWTVMTSRNFVISPYRKELELFAAN